MQRQIKHVNTNCLTFQRDGTILLDATSSAARDAERLLGNVAELVSAAGDVHRYRITDLSIWAGGSSGSIRVENLLSHLESLATGPAPALLVQRVHAFLGRYGQIRMVGTVHDPLLVGRDPVHLREIGGLLELSVGHAGIPVPATDRGVVKAQLIARGYPVLDEIPSAAGATLDFELSEQVVLRDYQREAVDRFTRSEANGGLILLPCGAGKTIVGVAIAAELQARTLILVPNRTIGEQWADHVTRMTTLEVADVALFDTIAPEKAISIVTYQSLIAERNGIRARIADASDIPWGLIVFDEVHSLPADVFRSTASLQASRKLGLTATLVREDGREADVFALVGPPLVQMRWRDLEERGWISPVECYEVRVRSRSGNSLIEDRGLAAKLRTAERILTRHQNDRVIVAARQLREVHALGRRLGLPVVTGKTPHAERRRLYSEFRSGALRALVASQVLNVGVDLPDANVLIQVSGTFGSRLEEAQRLGRLLRPNAERVPARFYTLVLPDTREREFAERRQRFLLDQGYRYRIVDVSA